MSDKGWDKLNPLDQLIRRTLPAGMFDGAHLTITFFSGFEEFNTRPYHNYETWSDGYLVEGEGIFAKREDLDDAIKEWCALYSRRKAGETLPVYCLSKLKACDHLKEKP